jgi:hypothetical protein
MTTAPWPRENSEPHQRARYGRHAAQVVARQAVDGGEVVGVEAVLGAKDEDQAEQGKPFSWADPWCGSSSGFVCMKSIEILIQDPCLLSGRMFSINSM